MSSSESHRLGALEATSFFSKVQKLIQTSRRLAHTGVCPKEIQCRGPDLPNWALSRQPFFSKVQKLIQTSRRLAHTGVCLKEIQCRAPNLPNWVLSRQPFFFLKSRNLSKPAVDPPTLANSLRKSNLELRISQIRCSRGNQFFF